MAGVGVVGAECILKDEVGVSQKLRSSFGFSLLEEEIPQVSFSDRRQVVIAGSIDSIFDRERPFEGTSCAVEIALILEDACEFVKGGGDLGVDVGAEDLGLDL